MRIPTHRSLPLLALAGFLACKDESETNTPPPPPPPVVTPDRAELEVLSPENGSVFERPSAALTFRISKAAATGYAIAIGDGAPVRTEQTLAEDEEVTAPLALEVGVNAVELALFDADGETDRETLILIVEATPIVRPTVRIVAPSSGSIVDAASIEVELETADAAATGYSVQVGARAPLERTEAIAAGERRALTVELDEGANTIIVAVLDDRGVADLAETVVFYERPLAPIVELTAPVDRFYTLEARVQLEGRVRTERAATANLRVRDGAPSALALTPEAGGFRFSTAVDLELGESTLTVEVSDDFGLSSSAFLTVTREVDDVAPIAEVLFPRDGQGLKTRRVLVRGAVTDAGGVDAVWLTTATATIPAELRADGTFRAYLDLQPADNAYAVHARDVWNNVSMVSKSVYFGNRLGSGGANGGAIAGGEIYTWGRNNLGQTGLGYVSHESRTTWCDRTQTSEREIAWCKATTMNAIDTLCRNPALVTPTPADSPEAAACRTAARAARTTVCTAAGTGAPANCATSGTANLANACDAAYGAATPASAECEASLACNAYAIGTPERAACAATLALVPSQFPAPATPYAPVLISTYTTTTATTGVGQPLSQLGVSMVSLSFNQNAASAIDSNGDLWTWGDGGSGVLCLGDTLNRSAPFRVPAFGAAGTGAIAISRGYDHLLILRSDGAVYACGQNNVGQLGDGTSGNSANRSSPVAVLGLPADIVQVLATSQSSYALTAGGEVYAWGRNQYGNLGLGTASSSTDAFPAPALVPGLTEVVMIAGGRDHVLAARADGSLYAWGLNASNQVDASSDDVLSPVPIAGVTDAMAVHANGNQGFYEDAAGRLFGWGQNGSGNLGIPEDENQSAPGTSVFGLSNVLDVSIGALHGFARRGDAVFAWGWSFHGSLGAGASTIHTWPYRTPILVQLP